MKPLFIDIHSHLDICKNIPEIIEECNKKGIVIVSCGVNPDTNRKMIKLKKKYPELEICLGIYPLDLLKLTDSKINKEVEFIRENRDKIFGIGEVGLDLHHEKSPEKFEIQKRNLEKFVKIAIELNKPLVIHSRDAEKETIELLEKFNYKKIIMHCFSGSMNLVKRIVKNGWMLSIPSTIKYNEHFSKVVEITPIENLFCETDSPFLHPNKEVKGMENTSINIIESYKKISEIKNINISDVKHKLWENYIKINRKV